MTPLEEQVEELARRFDCVIRDLCDRNYLLAPSDRLPLLPLEITDEMLEAGAKSMYAAVPERRPDWPYEHEHLGKFLTWNEVEPDIRECWIDAAYACLSAALTHKGEA